MRYILKYVIASIIGMIIGMTLTRIFEKTNSETHIDAEIVSEICAGFKNNTHLEAVLWRVERGKSTRLSSLTAHRPNKLIYGNDRGQYIDSILYFILITEVFQDNICFYHFKIQGERLIYYNKEMPLRKRFLFREIRQSFSFNDRSFFFENERSYLIYAQGTTDFHASQNSSVSDFEQLSKETDAIFILLTMMKKDI